MRIQFEAVDIGTMRPVRDITPIITTDDAYVQQDLDSDVVVTGQAGFAGARCWLSAPIRVSISHDGGTEVLATCWPTIKSVELMTREVIRGTIQLDGMLAALDSTLLPTTYAIASGARASQVIADMCSLAGVQSSIDPLIGDARYGDTIFYDVSTSAMEVAQDAAAKAGVRLTCDRLGYIVTAPRISESSETEFIAGSTQSDIISDITKSMSFLTSPTRVIASYTSNNKSIFTTVMAPNAELRGRNFDMDLSVSDLPAPDVGMLRVIAEQALSEQSQETWSFSCLHREADAGDAVIITDHRSHERLVGTIQSIRTSLSGLCEQDITVRGVLA